MPRQTGMGMPVLRLFRSSGANLFTLSNDYLLFNAALEFRADYLWRMSPSEVLYALHGFR